MLLFICCAFIDTLHNNVISPLRGRLHNSKMQMKAYGVLGLAFTWIRSADENAVGFLPGQWGH